ncbi:deoxyguanosinetriphosphate triphosphohydrolase [Isobaculum melis]|uniref:dGTPase n=1 Tax=Isobaculum melis TaxID=142588 RepID=A0A1H9QV39_9LACT|nr:deoxyguanosinetriphosphate triphosphohydrolase [Isobaculum melis]SER64095.1 dGTPase [Isobaculum melis]
MEWDKLISNIRIPVAENDSIRNESLKIAFDSDYRRVVKSDSFRRLQDKTQVFPLDRNDFVRTRLTHSLEVAVLARDLLTEVIRLSKNKYLHTDLLSECYRLMETASLIHDIGNPPFGHFGEEAIRIWFKKNGPNLEVWEELTEQQKNDFLIFEGNAQTIRVLTKLHDYNGSADCGMRLTASTIDSVIKYTASSIELDKDILTKKKVGYFYSEQAIFKKIKESTKTENKRHPLVFLLEAADDIAYTFSDVEDGYNYGLYSFNELKNYLIKKTGIYSILDGENEASVIQTFIRVTQMKVYQSASKTFIKNYDDIMAGTFNNDLMNENINEIKLFKALKSFACDYIFNTKEIFDQEVLGFNIMNRLLDEFIPVVLKYDNLSEKMNKYEERLFDNISDWAIKLYKKETKGCLEPEKNYYRLKIAVDFVCSMTDGYARKVHDTLFK